MKQPPLSRAGDSGYDRLHEFFQANVVTWILLLAIVACVTLIQWGAWWRQQPIHPGVLTALTVAVAVIAAVRIRGAIKQAKSMSLGVRGEMVVGQILE